MDKLPRGVAGTFGQQEDDHVGDFGAGRHPLTERNAGFDASPRLFRVGNGGEPCRIHGCPAFRYDDGIDPNAIFFQFQSPLLNSKKAKQSSRRLR